VPARRCRATTAPEALETGRARYLRDGYRTDAGSLRPRRQARGRPGRWSRLPPAEGGATGRSGEGQGRGSRATAVGVVLVPPRVPASGRAGEQHGLACHPGPATSSADSARDVKPMGVAGSPAWPGTASGCTAGGGTAALAVSGLAAVRPGRGARALRAPGPRGTCRGRRSGPPWAGAQTFRWGGIVATMPEEARCGLVRRWVLSPGRCG
jgi:hypothetical protein